MLTEFLALWTFGIKPLEDMFQTGHGNARSLILDADFREQSQILHPDRDPPFFRAERLGVADQIA